VFEFSPAEVVGYVASVLIVVSLAMRSVVRLRSISLVGSVAFIAYGLLIGSAPLVFTNVAIACLNVWFLRAELGLRRDLGAVVVPIDSPFLADFVHYHADDIRRFQPTFEMPSPDDPDVLCIVMTRDGLPAGALIGRRRERESGVELEVLLDYVLRAYRDSRLGHWLFGPGSKVFRDQGITRLASHPGDDTHRGYLARVGFLPAADRTDPLTLDLT
jgi:hypothetical protein